MFVDKVQAYVNDPAVAENLPYPSTIENGEDALESCGLVLNDYNGGSPIIDSNVTVTRTGADLVFKDNAGNTKTLAQLAAASAGGMTILDEGTPTSGSQPKAKANYKGGGVTASTNGTDATQADIVIPYGPALARFVFNGKLATATTVDGAFIVPFAGTIVRVTLFRRTAGNSGSTTIDILKNGTTVYTTSGNRPSVTSASGNNQVSAGAALPDVTAVAQDDRLELSLVAVEGGNPQDVTVLVTIQLT